MKNKFCPNCGNKLSDNDSFCKRCGHKVTSDEKKDILSVTEKVKNQSINGVNKMASVVSEKSGYKIKPSYVIGFVVAVIILICGFFILRPKPIEGSYTTKVNILGMQARETFKFDGKNKVSRYDSVGNTKDKGTYEEDGDKVKIHLKKVKEIDGKISNDKKSIKSQGVTYKKENNND